LGTHWKKHTSLPEINQPVLNQNPLDLSAALIFGILLVAILLLGELLKTTLGDSGIYLLAATSGIADIDAITLSLTRMTNNSLTMETAVLGIVIAAAVNNLVKTAITWAIGNYRAGLLVGIPMLVSLCAGISIAWLQR
jgi:uncharacterized membrane protein (DUF4010 family)